jgi:hypothetical protein
MSNTALLRRTVQGYLNFDWLAVGLPAGRHAGRHGAGVEIGPGHRFPRGGAAAVAERPLLLRLLL